MFEPLGLPGAHRGVGVQVEALDVGVAWAGVRVGSSTVCYHEKRKSWRADSNRGPADYEAENDE